MSELPNDPVPENLNWQFRMLYKRADQLHHDLKSIARKLERGRDWWEARKLEIKPWPADDSETNEAE